MRDPMREISQIGVSEVLTFHGVYTSDCAYIDQKPNRERHVGSCSQAARFYQLNSGQHIHSSNYWIRASISPCTCMGSSGRRVETRVEFTCSLFLQSSLIAQNDMFRTKNCRNRVADDPFTPVNNAATCTCCPIPPDAPLQDIVCPLLIRIWLLRTPFLVQPTCGSGATFLGQVTLHGLRGFVCHRETIG